MKGSSDPQRIATHRLRTAALEPCHPDLAHELPGILLSPSVLRPLLEFQTHTTTPSFLNGFWRFELSSSSYEASALLVEPSLQPLTCILITTARGITNDTLRFSLLDFSVCELWGSTIQLTAVSACHSSLPVDRESWNGTHRPSCVGSQLCS